MSFVLRVLDALLVALFWFLDRLAYVAGHVDIESVESATYPTASAPYYRWLACRYIQSRAQSETGTSQMSCEFALRELRSKRDANPILEVLLEEERQLLQAWQGFMQDEEYEQVGKQLEFLRYAAAAFRKKYPNAEPALS